MTRIFSGTATVTNGDATVVITSGVLTAVNCPDDAPIALNGVAYYVASRTDSTHLELTRNYAGSTGSVAVEIDPLTPSALSVVNLAVLAANVQAQLNVLDKNSQGLFYNRIGVTGDTDPAPGNLAFDQSDPTAVTEFYIDNIDANQRSVTGLIELWSSGTVVLIRSLTTGSTAYAAYRLPSGVSDQSGYYKAETQYVDHDGVIADGEPVSIGWFRVGEGLDIDATGTLAGRDAYDEQSGGFVYVTDTGDLYRKNSATSGDWGPAIPFKGPAGDRGWAPRFAVVADGERRVMRLVGYVGGDGDAPTSNVGQYVSAGGYTATIGDATDIRGAGGATGASAYEVAVANGFVGSASAWLASLNGDDGVDGDDGTDPGVLLIWDDGTTDANPGSGVMRANNALATSATFLYVSKANRVGTDVSVFLATLDDSSSNRKGIITLTRPSDKAQATFDVVTLTDASGYVKVGVVNGGGTTFLDNDLISFQFAPSGDKGTDGLGAGNFVTEFEPAIDPTGNLVAFSDATGTAGEDSGIPASDVPQKSLNLSDMGNRTAALDNLHLKGADIASAATVDLDTATGDYDVITGTVATSAFTLTSGKRRWLLAAAAWPITAGANVDINNGAASYTCAAKDRVLVIQDGSVSRLTVFRKDGRAVSGSGVAAGEGIAVDVTDVFNPKVAIASLVRRNAAITSIAGSKGMAGRLFVVDAVADGFCSNDGIDAGTSSNYVIDTGTGRVTQSRSVAAQIPQATGTAFGTFTAAGGLAAAFDSTTSQINTAAARTVNSSDTNGYIGKNYSAAPKAIDRAVFFGSSDVGLNGANGGATTVTLKLRGKNGGAPSSRSDGTLLATYGPVTDPNGHTGTLTSSDQTTLWDYVWIDYETTGTGGYMAELQFFAASTLQNMTVVTVAMVADAVPAAMRVGVLIRPISSLTLNTDLTVDLSRDGGTTWSAATLTQYAGLGADRYCETATVSVAGQPSGSNMVARIKSLNLKEFEVRGFYLEKI